MRKDVVALVVLVTDLAAGFATDLATAGPQSNSRRQRRRVEPRGGASTIESHVSQRLRNIRT
jgi:hypothetical protein